MINIVQAPNIMALFHFNDTLANETGAATLTSLKTNTSYASGKFSKGLIMLGDGTTGWEMSNINFGTGDFTIDFWFYGTAMPTAFAKLFESTLYNVAGGIMAEVTPNTTTIHVRQCGSDYTSHQLAFSYSLNTWTHFAIVKKSGVITVYKNGSSVGSFTATNNLTATTMKIGASADTANNVSAPGVLDELRISNIARWTANFTPPTSPYAGPSITITQGGVVPKKHALRRRMMMLNKTSANVTVQLTGTLVAGAASFTEVRIDGVIYNTPQTITIPKGTKIILHVKPASVYNGDSLNSKIEINGAVVLIAIDSLLGGTYEYTVNQDCVIEGYIVSQVYGTNLGLRLTT